MNTKDRILLSQDDELLNDISNDTFEYNKTFNEVLAAYKALDVGDFTEKSFAMIMSGESENIVSNYKKGLTDQLESTGLKNKTLCNIVLQGAIEPAYNFSQAVDLFLNTTIVTKPATYSRNQRTITLKLQDLSFDGVHLVLSDEVKEHIAETYCRIYAEGDQALALHKNLVSLADQLQEFRTVISGLGLQMFKGDGSYPVDDHLQSFFTCGLDGIVKIKPSSINWAINYKATTESMLSKFRK